MKCPFRKKIGVDSTGVDVLNFKKTTTIDFLDCYRGQCPFWDNFHVKCKKEAKE